MHPYPHTYHVSASGAAAGPVVLSSAGVDDIASMPPPEFDGPEGYWSPETLLCAAVADCFVLSFRAIARAARFEWSTLDCRVEAVLDRREGVTRFERVVVHARLAVPAGADQAKARQQLERAERGCLVSNSLVAQRELDAQVIEAA